MTQRQGWALDRMPVSAVGKENILNAYRHYYAHLVLDLHFYRYARHRHVHMEYSSHFNNSAVLVRNFFVDLCNRPELFFGALSLEYVWVVVWLMFACIVHRSTLVGQLFFAVF